MGSELGLLTASLVVLAACGKISSDPTGSDSVDTGSGTSASVGGATSTTASTTQGVTTGGPACASPEEQACQGECINLRTSSAHCGSCGNVCPEDQDCILARCASRITCERAPVHYDAAEMEPSGGVAVNDGWLLAVGETLSLEHTFTDGPSVLLLTARGVDGEPRPHVNLTIGESELEPLLIRSAGHISYSLEHNGLAGNQTVSISPTIISGTDQPSVVIQSLEVQACFSLNSQCAGGGYYLPELPLCVPPLCSEPDDCTREFPSPAFVGHCDDGACRFPSCTARAASGLPLYEEYASPETSIRCFSYADLTNPLNNPRASYLAGDPQSFECPAVEALTWQVDPFRGEGTCVQGPVCGPNKQEEFGYEPLDDECCYMMVWICGP